MGGVEGGWSTEGMAYCDRRGGAATMEGSCEGCKRGGQLNGSAM